MSLKDEYEFSEIILFSSEHDYSYLEIKDSSSSEEVETS